MHGNVDEWCLDGIRDYTDAAQTDPVGPMNSGTRRVLRGGAWSYDALLARAADRGGYGPDWARRNLGFRCARVQT